MITTSHGDDADPLREQVEPAGATYRIRSA